jgi:hypothetical protein
MDRIKVIKREILGDLFFNAEEAPEVFFDEISAFPISAKITFYRNGVEFGSAVIETFGTHGGYEYFAISPRGLFPIFNELEAPEHLWASLFQEGDELEITEEAYQSLVKELDAELHPKIVILKKEEKTKKDWYNDQLNNKNTQRERIMFQNEEEVWDFLSKLQNSIEVSCGGRSPRFVITCGSEKKIYFWPPESYEMFDENDEPIHYFEGLTLAETIQKFKDYFNNGKCLYLKESGFVFIAKITLQENEWCINQLK